MGRAERSLIFDRSELPGLYVVFGFSLTVIVAMAIASFVTGGTAAGVLYALSLVVLGLFFWQLLVSRRYSERTWFVESLFFLAWIVSLRITGGGFGHGLEACAMALMALAVMMGTGLYKVVIMLLAAAVPVLIGVLSFIYPSYFYVPRSIVASKVGAGAEILAVAIVISLMLDRVVAAFFHERIVVEEKLAVMSRMITEDGMTGLANRARVFEVLDNEVVRARRYGHPLSVIMIDIDGFKAVNDTRGHLAGDEVIRRVAGVLRGHVQAPWVAGRRGGDEFLMVLPESGAGQAAELAERVRVAVQDAVAIEDPDAEGDSGRVTISAGIAQWSGEDAGALVDLADQRLYAAKRLGRNRIVFSC